MLQGIKRIRTLMRFTKKSVLISLFDGLRIAVKPEHCICFVPAKPVSSAVITKLCAVSACRMTKRTGKGIVNFKYLDDTYPLLNHLQENGMINGKCVDISKKNVEKISELVFGYSTQIDATSFKGKAVEKSDQNAQHDGRVINCPLSVEQIKKDCVYQKIIDNTIEYDSKSMVLDYRVPVHGAQVPLVYKKYRPIETRFSNTNTFVELTEVEEVFSADEVKRILEFARQIGIDYGEFDVLRDKADGKIYVVDANLTPWGPPNGLSKSDQIKAVERLGKTFSALLKYYSEQHIN